MYTFKVIIHNKAHRILWESELSQKKKIDEWIVCFWTAAKHWTLQYRRLELHVGIWGDSFQWLKNYVKGHIRETFSNFVEITSGMSQGS